MVTSKQVPISAFAGGVSKFVQIICSLVADIPALPKLFTFGVLKPCVDAGALNFK
jgi:hypothetical protein